MINPSFVSALFPIFLLFLLNLAQTQEVGFNTNATEVFENYQEIIFLNKSQFITRKFVAAAISSHKDLGIAVLPLDFKASNGAVSIYYSLTNQFPNGSNHDIACQNLKSFESCSFRLPTPVNSSEVFISLVCETEICRYKWRLNHIDEIILKYGAPEYFLFYKLDFEAFNLSIPAKESFSRIVFSVQYHYVPVQFHINADIGLSSGKPLIKHLTDRQILILSNSDTSLCFSCNITATILLPKDSIVTVEAWLLRSGVTEISLNETITDFLFSASRNSYILRINNSLIQSEGRSLVISFKSLSGTKKTLYVSSDREISDQSQASWNSTLMNEYYEEEDIIIEKSDVVALGLKGESFYLYVSGDINGLYMIHIKLISELFLPLHLGIIESGLIENNEIMNYEFEFWKTDDYTKLSLSTTMSTGHLNIYGRQCEESSQCQLIKKSDIDNNNNILYKITQNGLNMLEFEPKCSSSHPVCYYIFAIMGSSVSTKNSKYSLSLKHSQNIIVLMENLFHESHVEIFHSEVYKLIVEDHANPSNEVLSIAFFINQDLVYFISKDRLCFDLENSSCDIKIGNSLYPVVFQKKDGENTSLNGVYYMMILGIERSNVLIYPRVTRRDSGLNMIKLLEGRSFKSSLMEGVRKEYYQFHIFSESSTLVEINLESGVSHEVKIFISKDSQLPGYENYFLSSSNGYLSFTHYPIDNDKIYKVCVESSLNFENVPNHKLNYVIMYSTEASIKHIEPNHFFYDFIEKGKTKKFIFFPRVDQLDIIISKNVQSPLGADAYLKLNLSILLRDDNLYTDSSEKDITLTKSILTSYCGMKQNIDECPFFVTIENTFEQTLHYSLILRYIEHSIPLIDGKEHSFLLEKETKLYLHYIPFSKEDHLDIFSYSYGIPFDLYFTVFKNVNKTGPDDWPFQELTQSSMKYIAKNNYYIPFKSSIFNVCWPNCVLLVGLVVNNTEFNIVSSPTHKVHIMISSKMADLVENRPLHFTLESQQTKYLTYSLTHFLNSSVETLGFDLSNFFGETRLYLTVNNQNEEKMPNNDQFDFMSHTGNLLLSKTEILGLKKNLSIAPHLHIALVCVTQSCETNIIFKTANFQLRNLIHGKPYSVFLEKNQLERFEYFHYSNKAFEVKFNRESGAGKLSLSSCPPEKNISYDECVKVPSYNGESASFTDFWLDSISINKTDPLYCVNCVYVIAFLSASQVKGSINVVLEDDFLYLQEGKKFPDEVCEESYNLYSIKFGFNTQIQILVNIYSGTPQLYVSRFPHLAKKSYEFIGSSTNKSLLVFDFKPNITTEQATHENDVNLYIMVYGVEDSLYSITYKTSECILFLHEGLIEFDTLQPGRTNRYVFEIYHQEARPTLSVNLKNTPNTPESFLLEMYFKPQKNPYDTSNSLASLILGKEDMVISENSIMVMLQNMTGHYEFHFTNANDKEIAYSIIINTQYINMIPYNSVLNQIIPVEKAVFYETYAPNNGFLVFDLLQCVGEVKLFVSEDYSRFKKAFFDEEFQGSEGVSRMNLLKVHKGMIYFALYSTSTYNRHYVGKPYELKTKGYFKLLTHFYDSPEEIPENKVIPGNNGRISWQYVEARNTIKLSFEPIRCIGVCPEYLRKFLNVNYWVMISIDENLLNAYGKCSILNYENVKVNSSNYRTSLIIHKPISLSNNIDFFEYEFSYDHDLYYVSVRSEIRGFPGKPEYYEMYYEDIEIVKPPVKIERIVYYGLTAVSICLVVMLILCGCYYYKNYKRLQESLNYEVREVDNPGIITTLNASIEMQPSKRYQGLIEDVNAV